jgi:predicted Zn-dependent peptidase
MPHLHGFCLTLNLRAGRIYQKTPGEAHFLEHIVCRGVQDKFCSDKVNDIKKYGLDHNASTGDSKIQFIIEGNSKFFRPACRVFVNHIDGKMLTLEAYKTEKERILREIEEYHTPTNIFQLLYDIVWEDTSLAEHQTPEAVGKITFAQLKKEWKESFTAKNMFFYVTGNIPEDDLNYLYGLIEGYDVNLGKEERKNILIPSKNFGRRDTHIYAMPGFDTSVAFSFDFDMSKYDRREITFLWQLLVGSSNSLLYEKLSNEKGLIYGNDEDDIFCAFNNVGHIGLKYEVDKERLFESIRDVVEILNGIIKKEIPANDFERVKIFYTENTHDEMDCVYEMKNTMVVKHIFSESFDDYAEIVERYSEITKERLQTIAREIFRPENLVVVLRWEEKPNLKKIREMFSRL